MGVSPTKPLSDRAAELAFKLDELGAVCLALGGSDTEFFCGACAAY